jgi:AcrR family transcriptional regulator
MSSIPTTQEPRWRRLPEERPKQILSAALAVFGERGLAAARLEDIAKRAGLSKGTIYLYFPNKEALFQEMIRQTVVAKIEAGERQLTESTRSPTDELKTVMRNYWAFIRSPEFAPVFRLIHAEIHHFPELARFYANEVSARGQRLIASVIQRGIDSGEFREIDPAVAARMLTAPFVIHGLWCGHRECFTSVAKKTDEQVFDELMQFYLSAIQSRDGAVT